MSTVTELTTIVYTGDIRYDSLLDSVSPWNFLLPYRNTLFYTFDAGNGSYIDNKTSTPVVEFNASQKAAVASILAHASSVTGIGFAEVGNSAAADIHFAATDLQGANNTGLTGISFGYSHSNGELLSLEADASIWLDNVEWAGNNDNPVAGGSGYETLLHEIGHMLGLGHPFNSPNTLPDAQDNTGNTVMSYESSGGPKSTYQPYDLGALTWIYGNDGLAGNWGYNSTHGFSLNPAAEDITPPSITGFSPLDGSSGVDTDTGIEITFSEDIARGSGSITLKTAGGQTVQIFDAATSTDLVVTGNTLVLTPSAPLAGNTEFVLEIEAGSLVDLAGNPVSGSSAYNFTTLATGDVTPPQIESFSPADGSTAVAPETDILLNFNEAVFPGAGTISLRIQGGATVATWDVTGNTDLSFSGDMLTLELAQPLAHGTSYVLEIPSGAVEDAAGNGFAGSGSYDFTTAPAPDLIAPEIQGFSPLDGAGNVSVNTSIVLTFDEPIATGSGSITLRNPGGSVAESWNVDGGGNLEINGSFLTLQLDSPLAFDTEYSLDIPAGAIEDLAGNPFAGRDDYGFTTLAAADTTPPDAIGFTPADGALAADVDTSVQILFDEPVFRGSGDITLQTVTGVVVETFPADSSDRLQFSGNQLIIDPLMPLAHDTEYRVILESGSVRDQTGNAIGTLSGYGFTTAPEDDSTDNHPPTGEPIIFGDAIPGETLIAETRGIDDADGLGAFSFQWLRDGEIINGATSPNYVVQQADIDNLLAVEITYTDGAANEESLVSHARLPTEAINDAYARLIEMYVTILGRAPAEEGLNFWSSKIDDGRTFEDVAAAMWDSPGAREAYPPQIPDEDKVATVYRNVLVREPQEEGLQFWLERWQDDDVGPVETMLAMIRALTANNSSDPQAIDDKILFEAKVDIGGYLASSLGSADVQLAADVFDYLEAGNSIGDTVAYIDQQMAVLGQADIQPDEGLAG